MQYVIEKPVRKLVTRSTVRVVGYHASRKMKCLVPWESQIERDYYEWLEVDSKVIEFYAQPQTFRFKKFRYTPDALVISHQGDFFAEVKPDRVLEEPGDMERLMLIQSVLNKTGVDFRLILESSIREPVLRDNVSRLHRYIRRAIEHEKLELALAAALRPITIHKLQQATKLPFGFVLQCIAQGCLIADLSQEITRSTIVNTHSGKNEYGAP